MNALASVETVAEYWNRRPCNIRHSTAPIAIKISISLTNGSGVSIRVISTMTKKINGIA